jgi:threonine/homoserine/homoserine lactone efflux protein
MSDILPSLPMLLTFVLASFILAVTPGPAVLYIITRSIAQGRASGLASVAGVALGNMGNMIGASIGLAALFAVSTLAFTVVKFLGALYLIFIGTQMILEARRTGAQAQAGDIPRIALRRIFRDGFLVALFNPKTALFFAAFLPQFLDAHGNHLVQSIALGAIFVLLAAITDTLYVLAASAVRGSLGKLSSASRMGKYAGGTAFIGLGILTAFTSHKAK